jgi:ubiquitin C-terminal hydrolase
LGSDLENSLLKILFKGKKPRESIPSSPLSPSSPPVTNEISLGAKSKRKEESKQKKQPASLELANLPGLKWLNEQEYHKTVNIKGISDLLASTLEGYSLLYIQMEALKQSAQSDFYVKRLLNEWLYLEESFSSLYSTLSLIDQYIDNLQDKKQASLLEPQTITLRSQLNKQYLYLENEIRKNAKAIAESFEDKCQNLQKRVDYNSQEPNPQRQRKIMQKISEFELRIYSNTLKKFHAYKDSFFAFISKKKLPDTQDLWDADIEAVLKESELEYQRTLEERDKFKRPEAILPAGIKNIHNSCYMNSVLQVLLNTPYFKERIRQAYRQSTNQDDQNQVLMKESLLHFMNMWEAGIPEEIERAAIRLRLAIFTSRAQDFRSDSQTEEEWKFTRERQYDAAALFGLIASLLDYHFLSYKKFYPSEAGYGVKIDPPSEETVLRVPVGGCDRLRDEEGALIKDEEGNPIYITEQLATTVQGLIQKMFDRSPLCGIEDKRAFVSNQDQQEKSMRFQDQPFLDPQQCPPVLVMQLSRSYFDQNKNTLEKFEDPIPFPKDSIIDLSQGVESSESGFPFMRYRLTSFIEHLGSTGDSGHYISWVNVEGQWCKCDDDRVTKVSDEEAEAAKARAYLFVLERVES